MRVPRCPHCETELQQLGTIVGSDWIGENLWRCQSCPYSKNRFTVDGGSLKPYEVEAHA